MRFLLDENISGHTEDFLRAAGHEVIRSPSRTKDPIIASFAEQQQAILLTRDRDFLIFPPSRHFGIVVIRIHPSIAETITKAVRDLLEFKTQQWLNGKTIILRNDGYEVWHALHH